jgi:hypothetical protein
MNLAFPEILWTCSRDPSGQNSIEKKIMLLQEFFKYSDGIFIKILEKFRPQKNQMTLEFFQNFSRTAPHTIFHFAAFYVL